MLKKLIDYVMNDPSDIQDLKTVYKYPNIAAELLSCNSFIVIDFFSYEENNKLVHFEMLFKEILAYPEYTSNSKFNFTRAGYGMKIINNLINNKTYLFGKYILNEKKLTEGLLSHLYCKSIYSILQNLICTSPSKFEGGDNLNIEEEYLKARLYLYTDVIMLTISTANEESKIEVNANAAFLLTFILTKESTERKYFVEIYEDKQNIFVKKFLNKFENPVNNKLGNVILVYLEEFFKNFYEEKSDFCLEINTLKEYYFLYIKKIVSCLKQNNLNNDPIKKITTYGVQQKSLNMKIYRILEAIIMILKECVYKKLFDVSCILEEELEIYIYEIIIHNSFNNIVHNQIRKILILLIESNNIEISKRYFIKNSSFAILTEYITNVRKTRVESKKNIQNGFIGQMMLITDAIKNNQYLDNELNQQLFWNTYLEQFYEKESILSDYILGDIFISNETESLSKYIFLSIESIAEKYKDFLDIGLDESDKATTDDSFVSQTNEENSKIDDTKKFDNLKSQCPNPDLIQEIKDVSEVHQDITYKDYKYWKPVIDIDIEELLKEL